MTNTRPRERHDRLDVRDRHDDVEYARRGVATFGGGAGPTLGGSLREFVRRYGWRAYALPILVVITVAALVTMNGGTAPVAKPVAQDSSTASAPSGRASASSPPVAPSTIPLKSDAALGSVDPQTLKNSALPPGRTYTKTGSGTFRIVPGTSRVVGASGTLYHYDVEVERGVTGVSVARFASLVQSTLSNPKSWSGHGVRLQRVDASYGGTVDFRVSLTSAMTVRTLCQYTIPVETSCYARAGDPGVSVNRVVLNVARWVRGATPYISDLAAYRIYMINHEDGHAMGHQHAHQCLPGGLAPVMMQQTFGLKSAQTGKYCQANPWPYPTGAKGAPGAEQQDTRANDEYYIGD